ncbi:MAG TPA: hypothetical protein VGP72_21645 [Planctomycetota bacterium]|jgi:hypothetical protein
MDTGNPVFDYRADFRIVAARAQRRMTLGGIVLVVAGLVVTVVCEPRMVGLTCCGLGALSLTVGLAWGWYWRHRLREEFKAKYGPESEPRP